MKRADYKKLIVALSAIAVCWACSSDKGSDGQGVPIELRANMEDIGVSVDTKAALNGFDHTPVVFANRLNSEPYSGYWNARISVQGFVTFIPQRIYNMDDKTHYLRGFYPVPAADPVGGIVNYDIDTKTDIMVSTVADIGSMTNKVSLPFVTFRHLLTQFRFELTNDSSLPYPTNRIIKKVTLKTTHVQGLAKKGALDLATGLLAFSDYATELVIYDSSVDTPVNVPSGGYGTGDIFVVMFEAGKEIEVTAVYQDEDGSDKSKSFLIDLSDPNSDSASEKYPLVSRSYKITFQFKGLGVDLTPNLSIWGGGKINGNENDPVTIW